RSGWPARAGRYRPRVGTEAAWPRASHCRPRPQPDRRSRPPLVASGECNHGCIGVWWVAPRLDWVLLAYRIPREPSTPRIAVWRKLRRLGVVQVVDGLVALPADARTKEQLEWLADDVVDAGGGATVSTGRPGSLADERT